MQESTQVSDGTHDLPLTGGAQPYAVPPAAKPARKPQMQHLPYYRLEVGEAFRLTPKSRVMVASSLFRYLDLDAPKFILPWRKVITFRPVKGAKARHA